jgi:YidC/Oxa1 family membrane protein insertase
MEQRTILAIALMMALLFGYMWVQETYFAPPPKKPQEEAQQKLPAPTPAPPPAAAKTPPAAPPAPPSAAPSAGTRAPAAARPPQRIVSVDAPGYRGAISSEGGKLQEWTLRYRGDKPMVSIGEFGPAGLLVAAGGAPAGPVPMVITGDDLKLGPARPKGELVLSGEEAGLRIRQTLTLRANGWVMDAHVRIENPTSAPRTVTVSLPWVARPPAKGATEKFPGQHPTEIVWSKGGDVTRIEGFADGAHLAPSDGGWIAIGSTWYLAAFLPKTAGFQVTAASEGKWAEPNGGAASAHVSIAVQATPTIAPGQAWEGEVALYVGPKEYDHLAALGLEGTLNFGGFPLPRRWGGLPMEWLGVPILKLMNWVYRYVGNYGVAIILLTVVSKVLFFPLTVKSMRSMKAMQALAPQVNALRSKYKSDPQRLQRESLELYRKHKVNPMGGCLPMVAQVPIFYALYLALSVSVELQNAAFLCLGRAFGVDLWICDLAAYDPTYVLPILMGVTMFVQQRMTPTMGDPRQAKMMLVMPFVFTFMFLNLPSGLVLYWTVSNILQILQQWYMDRPARRGPARELKDAVRA